MGRITHRLSLTVGVENVEQFDEIYRTFGMVSNGLARRMPDVSVSSYIAEDDEDPLDKSYETYTEDTLAKVRVALREMGVTEEIIPDIISSMQNHGILFRERVR